MDSFKSFLNSFQLFIPLDNYKVWHFNFFNIKALYGHITFS